MDFRALLHNKWALAGLGVAGAAGAYVLIRRQASGGGGSSSGSQASPAYSGGVGSFDSTGTDVAGWLGNYSGNLQNQLDEYQRQLRDALGGLTNVPPGDSGTGSSSAWVNVFGGQGVDDWITSNGYNYDTLLKLNPDLAKYISWKQGPQGDHSQNTWGFNTAIKVK